MTDKAIIKREHPNFFEKPENLSQLFTETKRIKTKSK